MPTPHDRSITNADYNGGCESKLDGTCNPRHADLAANRARLQKDIASDLGAPLGARLYKFIRASIY